MPTTTVELCPDCGSALTSLPDEAPWCGACEWNLGHFSEDPHASWFWRRIEAADQRAGFRSDLRLAQSPTGLDGYGRDFWLLTGLSAAITLLALAALGFGVRLLVAGGSFWPFVSGLLLIVLAILLRPRFGRLRPMLKTSYRVERQQAPGLHALIDRIAAELETPRPDVLLVDFDWNADVSAVGFRRQRVLRLGVPLMLALQPQQLVALLAHELGHLQQDDNLRGWLTAPARTTFGRLSRLIRPPRVSALELGPGFHLVWLLAWQLTGGLLSWLLFAVHLSINAVAARDDRAVELRADAASARAAGSEATLEAMDVLAMLPMLTGFVQHHVPKDEAAVTWRRMLRAVQDREAASASAWRQLSTRTTASLFASHPAPGRRHQWLATRPAEAPAVVLSADEAAAIEREIRPYAEALHRTMLHHVVE